MAKVSIRDLDKAEVLAALYNQAKPLGMGMIRYVPGDMPVEEARRLLADGDDLRQQAPELDGMGRSPLYFDYLKGRVMKVDLGGDEVDTLLYDRDNGVGSGERVIEGVRSGLDRGEVDAKG